MEKWCVEFEIICEVMSKEIEKRKQIRIEIVELNKKLDELVEKHGNCKNPDERGRLVLEFDELNDKLEQLELEYDMANYMVKRLKEERRAVLEK